MCKSAYMYLEPEKGKRSVWCFMPLAFIFLFKAAWFVQKYSNSLQPLILIFPSSLQRCTTAGNNHIYYVLLLLAAFTLMISSLRTSSLCSFSVEVEDKHSSQSHAIQTQVHNLQLQQTAHSVQQEQINGVIMMCYLSSPLCVWEPSLESHQQGWLSLQLWGEPVRK